MTDDSNIEVVIIDGHKVEMERRICAGGCGREFRVQVGSKVTRARSECATVCSTHNREKGSVKSGSPIMGDWDIDDLL